MTRRIRMSVDPHASGLGVLALPPRRRSRSHVDSAFRHAFQHQAVVVRQDAQILVVQGFAQVHQLPHRAIAVLAGADQALR